MVRLSSAAKVIAAAALVSTTCLTGPAATAAPLPNEDTEQRSICAEVASMALAEAESDGLTSDTASFACLGDQIVVTTNEGTGQEERIQRSVRYTDSQVLEESAVASLEEPLIVPFSNSDMQRAIVCNTSNWDRAVVSEREDFIFGCLVYGVYNPSTNVLKWQRVINWEWTMYPGWNSPQNKIKTVPTHDNPILSGQFSTYKQNGPFPPTWKSSAAFENYGNQTTSGWNSGSTTTGGRYSVRIELVRIRDSVKAFDQHFDGSMSSHRFECDSGALRCYFPNGQEAGL